jgi:predicted PurR-regulated permease PerM
MAGAPKDDPAARQPLPRQEGARVRPMVLFRWGLFASLGVVVTVAMATAVYTARDMLIRALIALFLAISLDPVIRTLTRWRIRRGVAILLVVVVGLGLVAAFLQSVIPAMAGQFQAMVKNFPHYLASLQDRSASFRQVSDRYHLTSQVESVLGSLPARLTSGVFGIARRAFAALLPALTVAALTIYFLADLPRLRRGAALLVPKAHQAKFSRIAEVMVDKVGAYMIGNILISLAAGLAAFAALSALSVPFAVPLAFVVAVTDLIPMIGATLGAVICIAVALLATRLWPNTVLVTVFFVVYQQVENYVLAPRIMRGRVQLSATEVLLASLIGGAALGLVGVFMAIPIAAGVKVLLAERLQARDAAAAAAPGDGETSPPPGQPSQAPSRAPPPYQARPLKRRRREAHREG